MPPARTVSKGLSGRGGLLVCPKTMPIRINLLAEAQAAAELRRKNPVKRGIWIGSFLVCVIFLWIVNLQLNILFEQKNFHNIEADWKTKMTNYAAVTNEMVKSAEVERKLAQLDYLSTNRFLWGPVLNALQQTVVDQVQVTRVRGDQSIVHEDAHDIVNGASKEHIRAGMVEKVTLVIDAKDLKPDDESYAKYKKNLSSFDFFTNRLQGRGFIMAGTLGPRTVDPVDPSRQFITFTLAAQFPEERHDE